MPTEGISFQLTMLDEKPFCQLSGKDGNVFAVIGTVAATLKKAGLQQQANEFKDKAFLCGSYDEVLQLCFEYVDVR